MARFPPELAALLARLSPQQQQTFLAILQRAHDEESFSRELANHPGLLSALQAAVASGPSDYDIPNNVPHGLQAILQELSQPAKSVREMPRRIELCRQALALVEREENAELWGFLHNELANSLAQNPQGSRADDLERAKRVLATGDPNCPKKPSAKKPSRKKPSRKAARKQK